MPFPSCVSQDTLHPPNNTITQYAKAIRLLKHGITKAQHRPAKRMRQASPLSVHHYPLSLLTLLQLPLPLLTNLSSHPNLLLHLLHPAMPSPSRLHPPCSRQHPRRNRVYHLFHLRQMGLRPLRPHSNTRPALSLLRPPSNRSRSSTQRYNGTNSTGNEGKWQMGRPKRLARRALPHLR